MYTQNTEIHISLWHKDFWAMAVANMLLSIAVYMYIPALPVWMAENGMTTVEKGIAMGVFILGLLLAGLRVSYLVQRYRRNRVCIESLICLAVVIGAYYFLQVRNHYLQEYGDVIAYIFRFFMGAFFGFAQMVLRSTLIMDKSESNRRTEANYSSSWFGRFAISLGPVAAIVLYKQFGFDAVLMASAVLVIVSALIIATVKFPFRTPEEGVRYFSLDRFFLPQAAWLFVNMVLVMFALGLVLSLPLTIHFYAMMMVGFLLSILSQRFVFENADLKSEIVSGLILVIAAIIIMLRNNTVSAAYISPALFGIGIGLIASRFLLFFIKLSHHCQRATSQSTYIVSWETGLALGLFFGFAVFRSDSDLILNVALGAAVAALLMYNFFTHAWYMRNKSR